MTTALQGKRMVLVGGAGFIGHHLAMELVRRGAHVEVIDGLQVNNLLSISTDVTENRELYLKMVHQRLDRLREAGVPLHPLDARDYHGLCPLLSRIKPHVVVHLAAVSHAGRSNKDPFSTFDHSLRTLENSLDASRGNIEHFIFLSSSMVYGNFQTESVDETHPLEPIGIYGALKLAGEKIVIAYQQVFDLAYTIIRPSALYGPRCVSRRVGQIFIESALQGRPLRVDGDGSERLDFTYIDDLVSGICLTIERPEARNQIFNMTYGNARPIKDLVAIIQRQIAGTTLQSVERDRLMPIRGTLNIDKARRQLGYAPRFPIDEGFPRYIDWYRSIIDPASVAAGLPTH